MTAEDARISAHGPDERLSARSTEKAQRLSRLCCTHCRADGPHDADDHQEPCEWCACSDCGHHHTPEGCVGDPTPSDLWAGVSVSGCDCDFDRASVNLTPPASTPEEA